MSGSPENIEEIHDENLLREMWKNASDGERKRQLRSRMYKLREQRLKDLYNREGILENILKHDEEPERVEPPEKIPELKSAAETSESPTKEVLKSMIIQTDRGRQYQEIRDGTKQRKKTGEDDIISQKRPNVTTYRPSSSKTTETVANRAREGRTSPQKSSFLDRNLQTEGENESKRIPSNKVTKGMLSPPTKKRSVPSLDEPSLKETPPRKTNTPRFMAPTKSRENAVIPNPNLKVSMRASPTVEKSNKAKNSTAPATITPIPTPVQGKTLPEPSPFSSPKSQAKANQSTSATVGKSNKKEAATKPVLKNNTEDYIIRELDILDSYLAQRSSSMEEKPNAGTKKGMSEKKSLKPQRPKESSPRAAKKMVDVQESGEEPLATRTVYKYNCAADDCKPADSMAFTASTLAENENTYLKRNSAEGGNTKKSEGLMKMNQTPVPSNKNMANASAYEYDILNRPSVLEKNRKSSSHARSTPSRNSQSPYRKEERSTHRVVKKGGVDYARESSNEDFDQSDLDVGLIRSRSFKRESLKSPGAVLKAKSLFEERAHEAALDKASPGFRSNNYANKVTKNAAIFEARSRGERVSVSSESSSNMTGTENVKHSDLLAAFLAESPSNLPIRSLETGIRSPEVTYTEMSYTSRQMRKGSPFKMDPIEPESELSSTKKVVRSNSKVLEAKVEAMMSRGSTASESPRLTQAYIKSLDDVALLEKLIEESKSYDERSNIRTRIREIKRGKALKVSHDSVTSKASNSPYILDHKFTIERNPQAEVNENLALATGQKLDSKNLFSSPQSLVRENSMGEVLMVTGKAITTSRDPRSAIPNVRRPRTHVSAPKRRTEEFPPEVDSTTVAQRAKGQPLLLGRKSPSPTPNVKLPASSEQRNDWSPPRIRVGRVKDRYNGEQARSPGSTRKLQITKSHSLDRDQTKTLTTEVKASRKSIAEAPVQIKKNLTVEDFLAKEGLSGFANSQPSFRPETAGFEVNANLTEPQRKAPTISSFLNSNSSSEERKTYVVGHVAVDPPSQGFQRVKTKNLELITSSYGVGPTDDNGKPLFGLRALRKVKEMQNTLGSDENTDEKETSDEVEQNDTRPSSIFGLRALRKTPFIDPESQGISSSTPSGLNTFPPNGEDTKVKPKSILKKTSSFSSSSSETKGENVGLGGGNEPVMTTKSPCASKMEQFTSSLPQLSGERSQGLMERNGGGVKKPFDAKTVLPVLFAPAQRLGGSSVLERSKNFALNEDNTLLPLIPDKSPNNAEASESSGSGRSFLNDTSPVAGISDVLDRMKWTGGEESGVGLLNKFIGAQILMQGIEPIIKPPKLDDSIEEDARNRIENRLQALGGVGSISFSKTATRSADVTGELMPLILGQLQASLGNSTTSGGGSSGNIGEPGQGSLASFSYNDDSTAPPGEVRKELQQQRGDEESCGECLFDSGTESGEDRGSQDGQSVKPQSTPPELSSFMDGIRHSLNSQGLVSSISQISQGKRRTSLPIGKFQSKELSVLVPESDLVQQVDKVLTLLKETLIQDPNALNERLEAGRVTSGAELIPLIDRLKASLSSDKPPPLPSVVGSQSPSPPKEPDPPDLIPPKKLPWASPDGEGPWKLRAAKKRPLVRSKSIGVSNEELEEARRNLQEEAFRSALRTESKNADSESKAQCLNSLNQGIVFKSPEQLSRDTKRLGSFDDSSLGSSRTKLKPFRTFSLENKSSIPPSDPSLTFFTPEEAFQIAIHKAAINKQVSEEEERRKGLGLTPGPALPKPGEKEKRDFSLALPKPYVAPSSSSSDEQEGRGVYKRGNGQLSTANAAQGKGTPPIRSIENVQISLKETGDMPQLQIAITLNTNQEGKKRFEGDAGENAQNQGSSDDSSGKASRYRSKSERKKKMKRANTIDVPLKPGIEMPDENEQSEEESTVTVGVLPVIQAPPPPPFEKQNLFYAPPKEKEPPLKPGFLGAHDSYWNSRFSTLKTSFESSSQGSSPSLSPIPPVVRGLTVSPAHPLVQFKVNSEQSPTTPMKPVWAAAKTSDQLNPTMSSVRKKLSVFENRVQPPVLASNFEKIGNQWNSSSDDSKSQHFSPSSPVKTAILQRRENFERKLSDEGPISEVFPRKPLIPIYEGVHTVHATKSALEAMQRHEPPPPPLPQRAKLPTTEVKDTLYKSGGVPLWAKAQGQTPASTAQSMKTIFESKGRPLSPSNSLKSSVALKKTEFENFQLFGGNSKGNVKEKADAIESEQPPPSGFKLSVFGLAKSFDEAGRQNMERRQGFTGNSPFLRRISSAPTSRAESLPESGTDEPTINSPVVSKVMRGPQQQRATFSNQEISNLGSDHPSADRIRNAHAGQPMFQGEKLEFQPKVPAFPPRTLVLPSLVKSSSGENVGFIAGKENPRNVPYSATPLQIPKQKSFSEFPSSESHPRPPFATQVFKSLGHSQNASASTPVLSNYPKAPFPIQLQQDKLKRTASGSSIFDRAKSLYISSRDAKGIPPASSVVNPSPQRRKPPSLPRANTIFPKQYEAQMSPESADKKQREVEAYFKFDNPSPPQPPSSVPSRYSKGKRDEGYETRIRKSASQGKIMSRQKSYSDGDDEDDNVDQIFESLFKASVESKMAKTSVSGDTTSSETAQMKATKSATQSKAVEKSASVEESKTPTGSTIVKKQTSVSKSSYSSSSTSSAVTSQKVTTTSNLKALDEQNSVGKSDGRQIFQFTNPALKTSAASVKDGLIAWCQGRTREYQNVKIENFSSSWSDGLGFCALIHHFFKDAFDYDSLSPKNRKSNFELAFKIAEEKAGIYPLLDPEDMVAMGKKPDWKCVFTYVQSMYQKLKDL